MRPTPKQLICALTLSVAAASLYGQTTAMKTAAAPAPGLKAVFLNQLADAEKKLVSLAEATPQDKMAWRPAEGVRSMSEVFMHEAGANFHFMTFLGAKPPATFTKDSEKTVTDKDKVVQSLKESFAQVRQTVTALSDADMSKETKFFGGQMQSYQTVLFVYSNHLHEHLGQLIAYARQNGIVPPWSKKDS